MNFDKIKESYPKAWERLSEWLSTTEVECFVSLSVNGYRVGETQELSRLKNDRDLYDFFDAQGIYVSVSPKLKSGGKLREFTWYIDMAGSHFASMALNEFHLSRTAAESAAFEKAFEILENKLK